MLGCYSDDTLVCYTVSSIGVGQNLRATFLSALVRSFQPTKGEAETLTLVPPHCTRPALKSRHPGAS